MGCSIIACKQVQQCSCIVSLYLEYRIGL
eukprot:COSAG01_NODE_6755_length_3513_cov_12.636497_3_plen_28_part_01